MIQGVWAAVRRRPALAIAAGGVAAAALVVGRRRSDEAPPSAAVDTSGRSPIAGYGAGLTSGYPAGEYESAASAIERQTATIVNAINAQNARAVTIPGLSQPGPTAPASPGKPPAPKLTGDLGTIVIGYRTTRPAWYRDWLAYAGAAGKQQPNETPAQRTARLTRELNYYLGRK